MHNEPQDHPNQDTLPDEEVKKLVEANEQWATNRVAEPLRLRDVCRTLAEKDGTVSSVGETGYLDRLEKELTQGYTPGTQNLQAKLLSDPVPYPELDHLELGAPTALAVPAGEVAKPTEATKDLVQGNTKPSTPAGKYFNNLKGMVYLSSLLSQPGELFPAIELASAVQGKITEGDRDLGDDDGWSEDENIEDENVSESEDDSTEIDADLEIDSMENDSTGREDFDRVTLGPNSPDPPLDPQYKNALEQALRKLAQEIKEKSDCGMDVVKERADFAMIVKQLKSGTFCGRIKNDSDSTERPRQSVSKAIRTALRAIRKVSPADADHIEANLSLGTQIVYLDTSRKLSLVRAGEGWLLQ